MKCKALSLCARGLLFCSMAPTETPVARLLFLPQARRLQGPCGGSTQTPSRPAPSPRLRAPRPHSLLRSGDRVLGGGGRSALSFPNWSLLE